ncbi:uncharacterized protein CLUP02_08133 [Colletotrichum lupini]|uniref:Uncharacterized protein n=1 Tax=Colletotrichum lupini TaxID=145971 RepID=A0A9Q8WGC4_9PEZI|nr:uncharacterized protein CLUP02_08133 [Colletotrichum lupini]UQC82643.1 hypothetical protein CLUP02_08133 [Colletotrichum lupini]
MSQRRQEMARAISSVLLFVASGRLASAPPYGVVYIGEQTERTGEGMVKSTGPEVVYSAGESVSVRTEQ